MVASQPDERGRRTEMKRYSPTADDLRTAAQWRQERTVAAAWRVYRSFASDPRWEDDNDLPVFDVGCPPDGFERLFLRTRPDARVLLVCEKMVVLEAADTWSASDRPSAAHTAAAALSWVQPLPSAWTCRTLYDHAKRLEAPLLFFGDLDPQALHLFAALRAGGPDALLTGRKGTVPVQWVGLDGRWVDFVCKHLGVSEVPMSWQIRSNWLDQEYWHIVQRMVPDARRLLGVRGCAMLDRGVRIEADAFLSTLREPFLQELGRRLRLAGGARRRR
jgi:hypothetical protein